MLSITQLLHLASAGNDLPPGAVVRSVSLPELAALVGRDKGQADWARRAGVPLARIGGPRGRARVSPAGALRILAAAEEDDRGILHVPGCLALVRRQRAVGSALGLCNCACDVPGAVAWWRPCLERAAELVEQARRNGPSLLDQEGIAAFLGHDSGSNEPRNVDWIGRVAPRLPATFKRVDAFPDFPPDEIGDLARVRPWKWPLASARAWVDGSASP